METSNSSPGDDAIETIKFADSFASSNVQKRKISFREADTESYLTEKDAGIRESDFKKRQVCSED